MTVHENGHRYKQNEAWETKLHQPYDYNSKGLMNKVMSHKITETNNPILKTCLDFYEKSLVMLMKVTDTLKNFKNPCWLNR